MTAYGNVHYTGAFGNGPKAMFHMLENIPELLSRSSIASSKPRGENKDGPLLVFLMLCSASPSDSQLLPLK